MTSRREFVTKLGAAALVPPIMGMDLPALAVPGSAGKWDLTWMNRIKNAKHRAIFDMPSGDNGLQLAARFYENIDTVYSAKPAEVVAVVNARTRSVGVALNNAMWEKYPLAEEYEAKDSNGNPSRVNPNYSPQADWPPAYAAITLEKLHEKGLIVLACDFALGHLSNRLAKATSGKAELIHADMVSNLVPGGYLVPSGMFGLAEAQNLGCAFIPG